MRLRPQSLERRREAPRTRKGAKRRQDLERVAAQRTGFPVPRRAHRRVWRPALRTMKPPWSRKPPRVVYVGSHEDKLSRLNALHVDPDNDGRTREDRESEKKEGRPPPQGGMAGML
jgi:hypothetical protein